MGLIFGAEGLTSGAAWMELGVDFCGHGADSNGVGVDRFIADADANPKV